jgi:ubiquinone biosynthesis protein UbiJ
MPIIARLIAEVTRLAEEDSPEARAERLRLIIDELQHIRERVIAIDKRLNALERGPE